MESSTWLFSWDEGTKVKFESSKTLHRDKTHYRSVTHFGDGVHITRKHSRSLRRKSPQICWSEQRVRAKNVVMKKE